MVDSPRKEIRISARRSAAVEIAFADTGHGFRPGSSGGSSDPFFTTKEVGKGTGLGLSITYGMSRSMAARSSVVSRPMKAPPSLFAYP